MSVKPIPEGYHTATPYLMVKSAAKAIEFYTEAFGAVEMMRLDGPDGGVMHAEIKIGDSPIMLADECPQMEAWGPEKYGGSPVSLMLYVADVDKQFKQAIAAGAKERRAVQNQFYGDRSGVLVDPFGHVWSLSTHVEDLSPEEINKRFEALMASRPS